MNVVRALMTLLLLTAVTAAIGANSPEDLVSSYRAAHQAKDVKSIARMVHFKTQDAGRKATWLGEVEATFASSIASVTLVPLSVLKLPESERKQLPASLTLLNWLLVEFAPKQSDPDRSESTAYLVGMEDGRYFLVGP